MVNDSLMGALEGGIYAEARNTEWDAGFNEARRQAIAIARTIESKPKKLVTYIPETKANLKILRERITVIKDSRYDNQFIQLLNILIEEMP